MSSRAQRRANQRNAQLSTGPKTPEGKLVQAHRALCARCARFDSSRNNLRHGLAGRLIVANLSPSEAADFHELAASLHAEHAPQTATETLLVDRMAESFYMSSRAIALQSAALLSGDDKRLSLLLRYQTTHERAFFKSLSELTKLRKEKRQQQIGFEPQALQQARDEAQSKTREARLREQQLEKEFAAFDREPLPQGILDVFAEYEAKAQLKTAATPSLTVEKDVEVPAA